VGSCALIQNKEAKDKTEYDPCKTAKSPGVKHGKISFVGQR